MLQLEPALEALEAVMENLKQVLDARVYVALGRGLWDCTAREVFDYVEDLQEGEQHRVRPVALTRLAHRRASSDCLIHTWRQSSRPCPQRGPSRPATATV